MVGPKAAFSYKQIFEQLINFDIYSNGSLKKKKDVVWIEICNQLNCKQPLHSIKPLNLYVKVQKDVGNLLSDYKRYKNLNKDTVSVSKGNENNLSDPHSDEFKDDENEPSDSSDQFDESEIQPIKRKNNSQKHIKFTISLDQKEWEEISPIEQLYKNGNKGLALKAGWPDIIRHVIDDMEVYIRIDGHCKTCDAKLKVTCDEKPSVNDESITFTVETTNSRGIPHAEKRRLAGPHRKKIKEQLKNKKPKQWQRDVAATDMEHGHCEPPYLYKLPVLQKASQQQQNEALGIIPGTTVFDSLSKIKQDSDFLQHPICFDATASVTFKIDRPGGESSDVFLYVIVSHVNNMLVPLTQAISERNDTNFLTFWLTDWRRSGAKVPLQAITDMGKALQHSIALSFNNLTVECVLQKEEKNKTTQNEETFDETTSLTSQFIEKITKKIETSKSFDISDYKSKENDYYLPDFANRLSQLCKEFP
ncbi:hypothetical protein TSAR_005678 [Trichomalopsis sarcophagae]|uniref:Uncharacterized protein n=1 Tax=Trichomalopsis sarcophagae TaxID=543379 RepID=A0A232EKG3_9HYME|nr:hypothetical protein TSAR_005678 [Trichomalopsis sarcophagae]